MGSDTGNLFEEILAARDPLAVNDDGKPCFSCSSARQNSTPGTDQFRLRTVTERYPRTYWMGPSYYLCRLVEKGRIALDSTSSPENGVSAS